MAASKCSRGNLLPRNRKWGTLLLAASSSNISITHAFGTSSHRAHDALVSSILSRQLPPTASTKRPLLLSTTRRISQSSDENNDTSRTDRRLSDEEIERTVLEWVKRVVIGWNLCPFAEKPMKTGNLHVQIVRENDEVVVMGAILGEMLVRKDVPGTTLVVAPELYPDDFIKYLSVVTTLEEDLMDDHDLYGHVQVAPFHPLFEFEGSGESGVDNFTNRAPFPIFHILREEEVERAVDKLQGDAGNVWGRNVSFLEDLKERLGVEGVKQAVSGSATKEEQAILDEVLRQHRFKILEESKAASI